jgi:hypothetical protein
VDQAEVLLVVDSLAAEEQEVAAVINQAKNTCWFE